MNGDLTLMGDSPFDAIRREDERGEYWSARDLMPLLGYLKWERFDDVIDRARISMAAVGQEADREASRLREAFGSTRQIGDNYRLTRHACYVIAMNGDVRKPEIAAAQAYFAMKTREAETRPAARELSRLELIDLARESEVERLKAVAERDTLAGQVAELEPAAASWNQLADSDGDYSVADAAKILSRDPAIDLGERRLFTLLHAQRWIFRGLGGRFRPYQRAITAGRLAERLQSSLEEDGTRTPRPPQVRVTIKGLHELHRLLGGTGAVLLEVAS